MTISPNGWKQVCKDEDVVPPKKPLSKKTLQEMYAGRRRLQIVRYQETMPYTDFDKFYQWVTNFLKVVK